MTKPNLCDCCSALIAIVLLVADVRHMAIAAPTDAQSLSSPATSDLHLLAVERQSLNMQPGTASLNRTDVMQRISDLSALVAMGAGNRVDDTAITAAN
jgi:hypothetical protein